ncbi:Transglutaminase-like superfamily protein [Tistlia consotensis]|uniref:Transglutaminase-like superfamily protein n=1 Tax=Tistlia consotensis USBA 355 TaxID=560819 RepID=A0A1Y6BHI2_9PROT|nr:transglutaminase family protein [Tistlia consotensis]SMF04395.1 Transglutaminase-like superfamily protein [Tistlia consotensis USBA 355]SNR54430.1 Transglutaminase-like superfamily protein [Tistlia consotensis]
MTDRDDELEAALAPTAFIDSDSEAVRALVARVAPEGDPKERAIRLYYAIRDEIRYDPYSIDVAPDSYRASVCLARGIGFCINKAVVLAAAARAVGVPARLGFADVRNHLATPRLLELIETDLFYWHGYTSLHLDGRWVKATPAFNLALCDRFGVLPLEFDGESDSVFHPFDRSGRQHMEYVAERGEFDDLPFEAIAACLRSNYPRLLGDAAGDFHAEAGGPGRESSL